MSHHPSSIPTTIECPPHNDSWAPRSYELKGTVSPDCKCLEVISIKNPLLGNNTPDTKKFVTLPLIFNGPLNFLSTLHQTDSNSFFYGNMKSVNTGSIPKYTKYIPDYTRYTPKVREML